MSKMFSPALNIYRGDLSLPEVMELEKEKVQEFVDLVASEYEEESILGNGVTVESTDSHSIPLNQCQMESETDVDSLNMGAALMSVRREISQVTDCEEEKVVTSLEAESEKVEPVSPESFAAELTGKANSLKLSSENQVLLPDHPEYKIALEQKFGTSEYVGGRSGVSAYYFDPDLFPDTGFVVSSQVYVVQEEQGSISVVSDDLDIGVLDGDTSKNRLQLHVGGKGLFPVDVVMWSEFTDPQNVDEEKLLTLDLPDPDQVL